MGNNTAGLFGGLNKADLFKGFGGAPEPAPVDAVPVAPVPVAPVPVAAAPVAAEPAVPIATAPVAPVPVPAAPVAPPVPTPAPAPVPTPAPTPAGPEAVVPPAPLEPQVAAPAPQATLSVAAPVAAPAAPVAAPTPVPEATPDEAEVDAESDEGDEGAEDTQGDETPDDTPTDAPASPPDPALAEPVGHLFGHLAALLPARSALAFTVALGDTGLLTVRVQPINVEGIQDLTLTGTPAEFDSGEFLATLQLYRRSVSAGLLAQAHKQLRPPAKPAAPSTPASDRSKGTLTLRSDVDAPTISATRNGAALALTLGDNQVPEGKYVVELSAEGYKPVKKTLKLERGKRAELDFALGGALELLGAEQATVVITAPSGEAVQAGRGLKEGMYHVVADQEGQKQFTWHGSVKAGATASVQVKFEAAPPGLF